MDNSTKETIRRMSVSDARWELRAWSRYSIMMTDAKIAATIEKILFKTQGTGRGNFQNTSSRRPAGERTGCYGIHIFVDDDRCKNDDRRR